MSGDVPYLHMLNLIAVGIPASVEFCRRLGVTMPADAAGPHVQGVEPDTLFTSRGRCWVTSTSSTLDTAKGQLFPNRMLTSLQRRTTSTGHARPGQPMPAWARTTLAGPSQPARKPHRASSVPAGDRRTARDAQACNARVVRLAA
jgi:hypothetical protein